PGGAPEPSDVAGPHSPAPPRTPQERPRPAQGNRPPAKQGTLPLATLGAKQPQAVGRVAQVLFGRAAGGFRVAGFDGLENRLVFALHRGHALRIAARRIVARAADHAP